MSIGVDEYYRMAEEGILPPDARVELINGEIIDMAPIGAGHGNVVSDLVELFVSSLSGRARVWSQTSVRLSDESEPEPDITIIKRETNRKRLPSAADALLIVEVSETSLRHDVEVKAPLYARYDIPEYWVVDSKNREFRFFRKPEAGQYTEVDSTSEPGVVTPLALPGVQVDLTHVLDD